MEALKSVWLEQMVDAVGVELQTQGQVEQEAKEKMVELQQRGCKNVYVYDDELVGTRLPEGWISEVADRIGPLNLPWITQGRCSRRQITPALMADVKRAGCKAIFWALNP